MKNTREIWGGVAQLISVVTAVQQARSSWAEFQRDLHGLITRVAAEDASDLQSNVLEELGRTAEHAQNRHFAAVQHSLRNVAHLLT